MKIMMNIYEHGVLICFNPSKQIFTYSQLDPYHNQPAARPKCSTDRTYQGEPKHYGYPSWSQMEVSWNGGTPKSSIYRWVFQYKPSCLGYPHGHGNHQMISWHFIMKYTPHELFMKTVLVGKVQQSLRLDMSRSHTHTHTHTTPATLQNHGSGQTRIGKSSCRVLQVGSH